MLQRVVLDPTQIVPPVIHFTPDQRHYLSRVLRLQTGDRAIVMDGQGHSWLVTLTQSPDAPLQAEILEALATDTELPIPVTLVVALPKGNALDEVVRQVTELGVSEIVPVISDRTLLNPSPQKLERWRRIAQESAEQSERQFVPTIREPVSFQAHLQTLPASDIFPHYLCVTRHPAPHLFNCLQNTIPKGDTIHHAFTQHPTPDTRHPISSLSIAIGPEGGWTEAEVETAIAAGYQPVSLGDRILRTVTAPVVALALIASVLESNQHQQEQG